MLNNEAGQEAPAVASEAPETAPEKAVTDVQTTETEQPKQEAPAKTFTQEELNAILEKRLAKAEAKAARREAQMIRELSQPKQERQQSEELTRDQFNSDAEWIDAKVERKLKEREAAQHQQKAEEQKKSIVQKTETIYAEAEKIPGFDREAFDDLPLTKPIVDAIIDSDISAKLMAYMANNEAEVERIAKLSPTRQIAEIGKMEAKIATVTQQRRPPEPIEPVGKGATSIKDLNSASMDDFKAIMKKQGSRWIR